MLKPIAKPSVIRPVWADVNIECQGCAVIEAYGAAALAGWHYKPTGEAFNAYYCPDCAKVYKHDRDRAAQDAANDI